MKSRYAMPCRLNNPVTSVGFSTRTSSADIFDNFGIEDQQVVSIFLRAVFRHNERRKMGDLVESKGYA
mgnify:CR=1 FL=1